MRLRWLVPALLVLLLGAAAWLLHHVFYTPAGLQLALKQLHRIDSVKIQTEGVRGVLARQLDADRIVIDHEAAQIDIRGLSVQPEVAGLLRGALRLERTRIASIEIRLKEREPPPDSTPHFLPAWLHIAVPDAQIRNIGLTLASGARYTIAELDASVQMTRWRIDVDPFRLRDAAGEVQGDLALRATEPLGLRSKLNGHWVLADGRDYRFSADINGNLDKLSVTTDLTAPARLAFAGTLLDLTDEPRATGAVRLVDFDGTPWLAAGQIPKVSGSVTVVGSLHSIGLDGTLTSPALPTGPLRLQGRGAYSGDRLEIPSFKVWLPRSKLSVTTAGNINFGQPKPLLALRGDWSSLRWPLTGTAVVESNKGSYVVSGAMPYRFQIKADARGPDFPAATFDAGGSFDGDLLKLDAVNAQILGGRVRGSGRLALSGKQPWRFDMDGSGLDLRPLRPEVEGRVNVKGSIEGAGFSANAPWTARIASVSGTMFGRALSGSGEITHRDGAFDLRQLRMANGRSRLDINGRWGQTLDLNWDADLRSLAIIAPGLAGELVSRGRARGTLAKPEVIGNARVRNLSYGDLKLARADAELDVDASNARPSRLDLTANELSVAGTVVDTVDIRARGLARDHDIGISLESKGDPGERLAGFRASVEAKGSLDAPQRAWHGRLTDAKFRFADAQATLLQPVNVSATPDRFAATPLCLESDESRLCVEGEYARQPEAWRLVYTAQDWPLKRMLRSLFGWQEFGGMLQASGWTIKEPGRPWTGGTTVLAENPTLDIPRNKFRSQRIELGGGRFDLYAEPKGIRVDLDMRMTSDMHIVGHAQAERVANRELLDAPLRGHVDADANSLKAMGLLVPELDRSEGKLELDVDMGGTLRNPRFTGDFQIRDGLFALYRTNLVLSKVSVDGRFAGDDLQFKGQGQTARGQMAIEGSFVWPDGVMTGTMRLHGKDLMVADTQDYRVIASPDLRLSAGAGGFTVDGRIDIPQARISPRDLGASVNTSPDERVVGIDTNADADAPSTLQRVRGAVRIVLGDAVRVDSSGLKARLDGELLVKSNRGDELVADGAINVAEGQYKAFGQEVKITKGRFSYSNTSLFEPLLELVAERRIDKDDVTVAVNVRGTLQRPFISITSEPAMSSNEALSYLLTGRSLDTLQSGEASNVNRAAENLALSGGGMLLGGIGRRLGLDEVTVERTDTEDTSVVIGKFLSPKLFVSYGISIAEAINTIKLRYTLNGNWSLKAESGLEQSADVEYKIER